MYFVEELFVCTKHAAKQYTFFNTKPYTHTHKHTRSSKCNVMFTAIYIHSLLFQYTHIYAHTQSFSLLHLLSLSLSRCFQCVSVSFIHFLLMLLLFFVAKLHRNIFLSWLKLCVRVRTRARAIVLLFYRCPSVILVVFISLVLHIFFVSLTLLLLYHTFVSTEIV